MKKPLFWVIILAIVLSGCGSQYQAEKLYWRATQVAKKLPDNPKLITTGHYQRLINAYQKVVERYPLEPQAAQAQFIIAQIYILENKVSEAEKELLKITQNFSRNSEVASKALFLIGNLYEEQNNWDRATLEYEKITDLYPLSSLGLKIPIYIAEHYQRRKEIAEADHAYSKAVKGYRRIIDDYSGTSIAPLIKSYLASTYVSQGDLEKAIDIWQTILSEYPQTQIGTLSLFAIGETYTRQIKDLQKAIEVYEDFVARYPQSQIIKQAKFQIGKLYFLKRDFAKARAVFEELIKEYSQEKELCANAELSMAICYEGEEKWEEALRSYKNVTDHYPNSQPALQTPLFIAQHYLKRNQTADAKKAFQEAILGYERIIQGNAGTAEAIEAKYLIGLSYISQQDWNKAIDSLNDLIKNYPDNPRAITSLFTIATIYQRKLNSSEEAVKIYEGFITKYPTHILVNLAQEQLKSLQSIPSNKQSEN